MKRIFKMTLQYTQLHYITVHAIKLVKYVQLEAYVHVHV